MNNDIELEINDSDEEPEWKQIWNTQPHTETTQAKEVDFDVAPCPNAKCVGNTVEVDTEYDFTGPRWSQALCPCCGIRAPRVLCMKHEESVTVAFKQWNRVFGTGK